MHPALTENNVAVITGAADGIGLAAAQKYASLGMRVCMADIDTEKLHEAASGCLIEGEYERVAATAITVDNPTAGLRGRLVPFAPENNYTLRHVSLRNQAALMAQQHLDRPELQPPHRVRGRGSHPVPCTMWTSCSIASGGEAHTAHASSYLHADGALMAPVHVWGHTCILTRSWTTFMHV